MKKKFTKSFQHAPKDRESYQYNSGGLEAEPPGEGELEGLAGVRAIIREFCEKEIYHNFSL